ncbi:MAG: UMP kinase [Spirochaetaceae bacterium]|jgi:uridylate kinase|nr:UMP kinase [Spirochaetaceae bacterium]
MITVISLGGSIIAPAAIDIDFLKNFSALVDLLLTEDIDRKFIFVVGGGGTARDYQRAFFSVAGTGGQNTAENADWIGIMATRLNAQLIKAILCRYCPHDIVIDPTQADIFTGRVLVAAGWKPGFSSDNDAVILAERFNAKTVINLSNIPQVMTSDPKKNPDAKPLDKISWKDFRAMVGDTWTPGKNVPFDPIASKRADESGIKVICAAGKDLQNFAKIIRGEPFLGTIIDQYI